MTAVHPVDPLASGSVILPTRRATTLMVYQDTGTLLNVAWCVAGVVYLVGTSALSVYFVYLLGPSMTNDLFWAGFNTTGMQSFVADAFNRALTAATNASIDLDLRCPGLFFKNDYSSSVNQIGVNPSYVRSVLGAMTLLEAVRGLRAVTMDYALWLPTQNCWVDMDRRWELAHTLRRQARCAAADSDNAAVYLEALLRNVDWDDWMSTAGSGFQTAILDAVVDDVDGPAWVTATASADTTVDDEVAYWTTHRLRRFALQWHNLWQGGMTETVVIANALGMEQSLSIKNLPIVSRDYMWTSLNCYWALFNDLWAAGVQGVSLVRVNASQVDFEAVQGADPTTLPVALLHTHIGPLLSIDMRYVALPHSLATLAFLFDAAFARVISNSSAQSVHNPRTVLATPSSWRQPTLSYHGGNPFCVTGASQTSYAQPTFGFYDTCSSQDQMTLPYTAHSLAFAVLGASMNDSSIVPSLHELCGHSTDCVDDIIAASSFVAGSKDIEALAPLSVVAADQVAILQVEVMQFALVNGSDPLLLHQLLTDWGIFGWVHLYDWAVGTREVVKFEGDVGSMTLISTAVPPIGFDAMALEVPRSTCNYLFFWMHLYDWAVGTREVVKFEGDVGSMTLISTAVPPIGFDAMALEVPRSTCNYLWYIVLYSTAVLGFVAAFVLLRCVWIEFQIAGRNLFFFNRVAAFVWVGRPVFLVRGVTAIILLSTAPMALSPRHGWTGLAFETRSFFETAVLTSEVAWLSYVLVDILLVIFPESAPTYAPVSAALTWIIILLYSILDPVWPTASVARTCVSVNFDAQLLCVSGRLEIGSWVRTLHILALVLGAVIVAILLLTSKPTVISAAGEAFLSLRILTIENTTNWCMDHAMCTLCGLIPFQFKGNDYVFDIKLWVVWKKRRTTEKHRTQSTLHMRSPSLSVRARPITTAILSAPVVEPMTKYVSTNTWRGYLLHCCSHRVPWNTLMVVLGLGYLVLTIASSIVFISVSGQNLANDFFWPGFNSTGIDAFLGNWFNNQLFYATTPMTWRLDDVGFADALLYNGSTTLVMSQSLYTNVIYLETLASDLGAAIAGLRMTPPSTLPYVFTSFCYLDFERRWAMANSAARQTRCAAYNTNGAVYLEAFVRNTDWASFHDAWGNAFEIAFGNDLNASAAGLAWRSASRDPGTSIADEVRLWTNHAIASFTLQWQNYKRLGLFDAFDVETAFGFRYAMTLKQTVGSWAWKDQTSLKMYWSFGADLDAVRANSSLLSGQSLLRDSPRFAYVNGSSLEDVMSQNGTLAPPFGLGFGLVRAHLGPFGSIDVLHVPVPPALLRLQQLFTRLLSTNLATKAAAATAYGALIVPSLSPAPSTWFTSSIFILGGNPLCDTGGVPPTRGIQSSGLRAFYGAAAVCGSNFGEYITPTTKGVAFATAVTQLSAPSQNVSQSCAFDVLSPPTCFEMVLAAQACTNACFSTDQLDALQVAVDAAVVAIQAAHVTIVQYALNGSTPQLLAIDLLDPSDPEFMLFGWFFLWDWATGYREVVKFVGDTGALSVLSTAVTTTSLAPNALEIPKNLVLFLRNVVLYVTSVLVAVSILVVFHMLGSRGQISGSHLFGLNRVAGIIWVGRPLLLLRSLTAMAVLSTARVDLVQTGIVTLFQTTVSSAVLTVLSAGEVTWFIYVLNDILMVYTQQYARLYMTKATYLLWLISAIWSFVSPVTHSATVARTCAAIDLNLQLVCQSGVLRIGDRTRFVELLLLCVGCLLLCYGIERWRVPNLLNNSPLSHHLSCEAKYLFNLEKWRFQGVYYLDKASAAMNGMLILSIGDTFHVLDIKTWRRFQLRVPVAHYNEMDASTRHRLRHAYPLVE
ncbi:hypothetical protein SPRG_00535 [Saprolegnia parasitica CBS 223.65]|uniref:Uncharacterized protein n=1 Tax=Saprolegnia parasitica (strain CBS 223.65) TaxID=695850 RepID=A0A067D705_SAPPC|nr:hypothetical protein SPRG_00535 [Saprolegnia parasitica CBS 223.65]KDO34471.1 hypothetical protein SPRG_00535 [Saprolegnia parasitica CBS 223.65]|eukprot:XP_012194152.1 hypothetical protein SPRG_00535 [Saprolegnia parasitica CBS 223.65]